MKHLLAAAFLAALPVAAPAVTITPVAGELTSATDVLSPGGTVVFNVIVDSPMTFDFSLAGSGDFTDLLDVTFSINGGQAYTWSTFGTFFGRAQLATAGGTLPSFTTSEDFYVTFFDGVASPVGVTLTLISEAVPPSSVPLPAAGFLLLAGLGAAGIVSRTRRSDAKAA
ncbi:VPLPA-CTERM sorting domain-containing protein [Haematobacter massiliensis]|uniref:VPLPA-CTERM sorting domain-containing protein n=1 Tax=Haematobacter massiliensis TaxID=195105 RepID=UPI00103E988D|nr:VPLPA-CTERM sorting domain-containing protein [Haematobacter massiliensis]QBJ22860.1 VPLPA-CTERM sorting domain-containing protein [Haematobacter massiliensis]